MLRTAGAALAGLLAGLAATRDEFAALAWVALVPFLAGVDGASPRATVGAAVVFAVACGASAVLPWLVPATAAYFGIAAWRAAAYTVPALVALAVVPGAGRGGGLAARPQTTGGLAVVWIAAVWTCWEAARALVFPGYPAAVLGLSQHRFPAVLQVASACGIAGVTFVLVAANAALAALGHGRSRRAAAATGVTLLALALAWGGLRLGRAHPPAPDGLRIVAVDTAARARAASTLERYLAASDDVTPATTDLVVWPESALPTDVERDRTAWAALDRFVTARAVPLLAGGPGSARREGGRLARFNSVHLIRPGAGLASHHKRGLVPFAERWPTLVGAPPAGFAPLDAGTALPLLGVGDVPFGVLVCFEITDAAAARDLARRGARFLVNATTDAWFTSVPPHAPWAVIRAVESGLPVVRAANGGPSLVVDALGRTVAGSGPSADGGRLVARVPAARPTFYARHGDVFLGACLVAVIAGVAARRRGTTISG
jgi:apolipoprotein N-acyltransferase